MTFSLVSDKVRITSTTLTSIYVKTTLLGEMLGFWTSTNIMGTGYTQAILPFLLSLDLYVMMYFPNIGTQIKDVSGTQISKSPLMPLMVLFII